MMSICKTAVLAVGALLRVAHLLAPSRSETALIALISTYKSGYRRNLDTVDMPRALRVFVPELGCLQAAS